MREDLEGDQSDVRPGLSVNQNDAVERSLGANCGQCSQMMRADFGAATDKKVTAQGSDEREIPRIRFFLNARDHLAAQFAQGVYAVRRLGLLGR